MAARSRSAVLATALAAALVSAGLTGMASSAGATAASVPTPVHRTLAVPDARSAGDALAAATTVPAATAALLTVLTGAGIGVDDGTGAPAATARVVIPAWSVSALAADHVAGRSISLADNAAMLDPIIRGGGGPAVTAASFSTVLAQWIAAPVDDQEGYLLRAVAELGRRTVPSYDLAKGAPADSPLPLLLLLEEDIALTRAVRSSAGGAPSGLRAAGRTPAISAGPGAGDFCDFELKGKDWLDKIVSGVKGLDKVSGWYFQSVEGGSTLAQDIDSALNNFSTELDQLEGVAGGAEQAEGGEGAAVLALLNAMLHFALTQGLLQVDIAQSPRPQVKHEPDADPNKIAVAVTVKASKDMPWDLAQCVKLLSNGTISADLPKPGDPMAKAHVQLSAGSSFYQHVKWDDDYYIRAGDPSRKNQYTDGGGTLTVHLETQPQKLPKTVKKQAVRDAVLQLEIGTQDLGPSASGLIAFLADKIAPWSNDYPVTVKQRVSNAITLKGSFDSNLLIAQIAGSLNVHSCDGFNGVLNGTFTISGDEVLVGGGARTFHVGLAVPFDQPENEPDAAATPKIGPVTTLTGRFGIEFIDDHTAELTVDGSPAADQSGAPMLFTVTQGADACPDS